MKIIHILSSRRFSGAENVVCQIINMFRADNDVEMIYCSPDGPVSEALAERNITFRPLKKMSLSEIRKAIKETKPDIIHSHDMRASFLCSAARKKIPLICHIHNNNFDSRKLSFKSVAFLHAAKKACHIFWVSDSSFNGYRFHDRISDKSSVLENIISIEELYHKAETDSSSYNYDVVFLGRLTDIKDPERFIRIFASVVRKVPQAKAAVVGAGDLEERLRQLCGEMDIEDNVDILGYKNNPLKILRDSRVMVMTSRSEGIPIAALEAMALGVPIVSTSVGGLVKTVQHGVTGFLSEDDDRLADHISDIITDDELHDKLSKASIEKASRENDVEKYKKALTDSYLSCVRNDPVTVGKGI